MSDRYTIEKQGGKWVASDGATCCEGDDPSEALYHLGLSAAGAAPKLSEDERAKEASDKASCHAYGLIRLIAAEAPDPVIENEVRLINKFTSRRIAMRCRE